ncbi:hypothetical protein YC2023_018975 [Brassica napus]
MENEATDNWFILNATLALSSQERTLRNSTPKLVSYCPYRTDYEATPTILSFLMYNLWLLQFLKKLVKAVIVSGGQRLETKHFKLTNFVEVLIGTRMRDNEFGRSERSFNYAVFFDYISLRKQENMNLMRICECVAQVQKSWIHAVLSKSS